jgi:hypothetical protein
LIQRLQEKVKELGRVPYNSEVGGNYPTLSNYIDIFGTWNAALVAAGFTVNRPTYALTLEEALEFVRKVGNELPEGANYTTVLYDAKAKQNGLPGYSSIMDPVIKSGYAKSWGELVVKLGYTYVRSTQFVKTEIQISRLQDLITMVSTAAPNDSWRKDEKAYDAVLKTVDGGATSKQVRSILNRTQVRETPWATIITNIEQGRVPKDSPSDYSTTQEQATAALVQCGKDLRTRIEFLNLEQYETWRFNTGRANELPDWATIANLINTGKIEGNNDWRAARTKVANGK